MKVTVGAVVLCVLTLATFARAEGTAAGAWQGQVQRANGPQTVQMALTVNDIALSGSIISEGAELSIENGTVAGPLLSFTTTERTDNGAITLDWNGTLNGDEIAFSVIEHGKQGTALEFVVNRQS